MRHLTIRRGAVIWTLRRTLRFVSPAHRRRWVRLHAEANLILLADMPERCWVGRGAIKQHAVYNLLGFYSICGQPVGNCVGGDMPYDINCWSCLRRLNKAAGVLNREREAAA